MLNLPEFKVLLKEQNEHFYRFTVERIEPPLSSSWELISCMSNVTKNLLLIVFYMFVAYLLNDKPMINYDVFMFLCLSHLILRGNSRVQ